MVYVVTEIVSHGEQGFPASPKMRVYSSKEVATEEYCSLCKFTDSTKKEVVKAINDLPVKSSYYYRRSVTTDKAPWTSVYYITPMEIDQ